MTHAPIRRSFRRLAVAALVAAAVPLAVTVLPVPAALAQSSSAALRDALAAALGRPLTPPEAWAVQQTVRDHLGRVREARTAFSARASEATGLSVEQVAALLPPLGRGGVSGERDPGAILAEGLGRALTPEEAAAVDAAEAARVAALAPHRAALVDRLTALTGVEATEILPLLPPLGL